MNIGNWQIKEDLRYNSNNFWVKIEGREVLVGLSDYGQWTIGDILYFDIAREGSSIDKGEIFGSIESGKWVGNLVSPVTGLVLKINPTVVTDPRQINVDPYGRGWIMRVAPESDDEVESLIDHLAYTEWIKEQLREEL